MGDCEDAKPDVFFDELIVTIIFGIELDFVRCCSMLGRSTPSSAAAPRMRGGGGGTGFHGDSFVSKLAGCVVAFHRATLLPPCARAGSRKTSVEPSTAPPLRAPPLSEPLTGLASSFSSSLAWINRWSKWANANLSHDGSLLDSFGMFALVPSG